MTDAELVVMLTEKLAELAEDNARLDARIKEMENER